MDYFYVKPEDVSHSLLTMRGDESKHIVRVLRKQVGDRIFVTDGNDIMYEAVIAGFGKTDVRCEIAAMHRKFNEPPVDITLAVSMLKNPGRFDFLIEKATEIGVRTIIPLVCQRTIPQHEKHGRLEKIALASMKQCGRCWLPRIQPLQTFQAFINNSQHWSLKLIPHEKTEMLQTISSEFKYREDIHSVLVAVGPEGGFTEDELAQATHNGFRPVSLSVRRLRSETAAIVAVAELLRRG